MADKPKKKLAECSYVLYAAERTIYENMISASTADDFRLPA